MSHTRFIIVFVCSIALSMNIAAQQKSGTKKEVKTAEKKNNTAQKLPLPYVYLGSSAYKNGRIQKTVFNDLLKQGLTAHDSLGNKYKVMGFDFSYGERNLYEDSLGNNQILTDYLTEYCPGNMLSEGVTASIYERTKAGDSVYFDQIKVLRYIGNTTETLPAENTTLGVGMKFVIIK